MVSQREAMGIMQRQQLWTQLDWMSLLAFLLTVTRVGHLIFLIFSHNITSYVLEYYYQKDKVKNSSEGMENKRILVHCWWEYKLVQPL